MVGFSIEGYYRSGSEILSIRRLKSTSRVRGFIESTPYDPLSFYPNELTSYIHKLLGYITVK